MKNIKDIFAKPIDRPIEEVIKVEQANEIAVATEINEYIATDSIRRQFAEVYKACDSSGGHWHLDLRFFWLRKVCVRQDFGIHRR